MCEQKLTQPLHVACARPVIKLIKDCAFTLSHGRIKNNWRLVQLHRGRVSRAVWAGAACV